MGSRIYVEVQLEQIVVSNPISRHTFRLDNPEAWVVLPESGRLSFRSFRVGDDRASVVVHGFIPVDEIRPFDQRKIARLRQCLEEVGWAARFKTTY